jgi:hypothetical protein
MTTTQIELSRLDAQWREAAELLRQGVDAEMAQVDSALRALGADLQAQAQAAIAEIDDTAELRILATIPSQLVR